MRRNSKANWYNVLISSITFSLIRRTLFRILSRIHFCRSAAQPQELRFPLLWLWQSAKATNLTNILLYRRWKVFRVKRWVGNNNTIRAWPTAREWRMRLRSFLQAQAAWAVARIVSYSIFSITLIFKCLLYMEIIIFKFAHYKFKVNFSNLNVVQTFQNSHRI